MFWHVVADCEDDRLVSRILHDVFLLGNLDKKVGGFTVADFLFDMVGRQHAFKVTNGVITKGVIVVADNQRIGLRLDLARFVDDDRQAPRLVLGLSCGRNEQHGCQSKRQSWDLWACHDRDRIPEYGFPANPFLDRPVAVDPRRSELGLYERG